MIEYLERLGFSLEEISNIFNFYNKSFILEIDLDNLQKVVDLLKKYYKLDIIKDLIETNLEIFTYPVWFIEKNIKSLASISNYLDLIKENPELLYQEKEVDHVNN